MDLAVVLVVAVLALVDAGTVAVPPPIAQADDALEPLDPGIRHRTVNFATDVVYHFAQSEVRLPTGFAVAAQNL